MKTVSKYFFLAVAACLSLTACEDMMDLQPEGATKTDALKQDAYNKIPANAAAEINAIYAQMIELYAGGTSNHNDFGIASCMMILESEGQDLDVQIPMLRYQPQSRYVLSLILLSWSTCLARCNQG